MAGLFRTLAMFLSNPLYSSYHPGSCCLRKSRSVLPHICFVCFEEIQPSRVLQLSPWRYKPDLIYFSHFGFFFVLPKQLPINIFHEMILSELAFRSTSLPFALKKYIPWSLSIQIHLLCTILILSALFLPLFPPLQKMKKCDLAWPPFQEKHTITNCIRWSQITVAYSLQDILKHITLLMSLQNLDNLHTCDVCWGNAPGCPLCHLNANVSRMEQPSLRQLERIPVLNKATIQLPTVPLNIL